MRGGQRIGAGAVRLRSTADTGHQGKVNGNDGGVLTGSKNGFSRVKERRIHHSVIIVDAGQRNIGLAVRAGGKTDRI